MDKNAIGAAGDESWCWAALLHLHGRHDADSVAAAMIAEVSALPEHLRRSLTWDRGTELARFSAADLLSIAASLNARPRRPTSTCGHQPKALDALLTNPAAACPLLRPTDLALARP